MGRRPRDKEKVLARVVQEEQSPGNGRQKIQGKSSKSESKRFEIFDAMF